MSSQVPRLPSLRGGKWDKKFNSVTKRSIANRSGPVLASIAVAGRRSAYRLLIASSLPYTFRPPRRQHTSRPSAGSPYSHLEIRVGPYSYPYLRIPEYPRGYFDATKVLQSTKTHHSVPRSTDTYHEVKEPTTK